MPLARATLVAAVLMLGSPGPALAGDGPATKIVGGTQAAQGEYPAQGFLLFDFDPSPVEQLASCGGTLVGPRQFLTAAHCAVDNTDAPLTPDSFNVFLGEVDRNNFGAANRHFVSAVDVNSSYDASTQQNDTAMLTLSAPVSLQPLAVVGTSQSSLWAAGVAARIIGWGTTSSGGSSSRFLLKADVPMVSDATCASDYPGQFDSATMVCAGDGAHDTCQGDSGGPLMVPGSGGVLVLAGVTSWGIGCAEAGHPGVYARLGAEPLRTWVTARIPQVSFTSSPASPKAGDTVTLSANSGPAGYFVAFAWDLDGDGNYNDAAGPTASKAYGAGTHTVGVQATGAAGDTAVSRTTLSVSAVPPPDLTAPLISAVSLTPNVFAVDRAGGSEKAVGAAKKGTTLKYRLSEQGRVVFTIDRVLPGRRSGRKCVKPTSRNRGRRKCTRYARFGRFAKASFPGPNSERYKGRIGKNAMNPGPYRATLVATDTAGNRSKPKSLQLRVVRR